MVFHYKYIEKGCRIKMEEKKTLLTYAGLTKLEEELHDLKVNKRKEVAEKIKMIAKELGYQPNIAAKALSSGNQILRIGVILQYADTPTIQTVLEGAKDAKQEVERFGGRVMIDQIKGGDVRQVLDIMRGRIDAIE